MKWEEEFDELLRDVGREHRAMEPPKQLESALLVSMRERTAVAGRRASVMLRQAWAWGVAAALIGLLAWGGVEWRQRWLHHPQTEITARHQTPDQVRKPDAEAAVERAAQPLHRHFAQARNPQRNAHEIAIANETGSLDVFVPLPVSEGLPQATQVSLVRVRLTGSDLQQYGLETPPEAAARSLLAEFVVGEDGLPRAIRIVQ